MSPIRSRLGGSLFRAVDDVPSTAALRPARNPPLLKKQSPANLQMSLSMNAHKVLTVHARLLLANEFTQTKMKVKKKYQNHKNLLPNQIQQKIANLAPTVRIRTQHVNLIIQTSLKRHQLDIMNRSIATTFLHNVKAS